MYSKNYTTLRWLTLMTIITWLFCLTLQDWGAIAAIFLTISTFGVWIYTAYLNKNPFKLSYSIITGKIEPPDIDHKKSGNFGKEFVSWHSSKELMFLSENATYTLYIQMKPRKSCDISSVESRFIEEGGEQPEISELKDINPQAINNIPSEAHRAKGVLLTYSTELHSNRGGKTVDYWCIFSTYKKWQGYLWLRVSIVNIPSREMRIPVKMKLTKKRKEYQLRIWRKR